MSVKRVCKYKLENDVAWPIILVSHISDGDDGVPQVGVLVVWLNQLQIAAAIF